MTKILVIEDDKYIMGTIIDLVDAQGYEVISAANGFEGIEAAKNHLPDLIICDIIMPVKNGYEVIMELSDNPTTALIPFIFLSAKTEKIDIRQGMELGADDYLTKPFRVEELLKAIEIRLKKSKAIRLRSGQKSADDSNPAGKSLIPGRHNKLSEDEYVFIMVNDKPKFLKIKNIKCITSEAEYSWVFTTDQEKLLVRKLIKNWEGILPESSFLRIHRSYIINLNYIAKIEKWFNNSFIVHLQNLEKEFIISRRYASSIRSRLRVE